MTAGEQRGVVQERSAAEVRAEVKSKQTRRFIRHVKRVTSLKFIRGEKVRIVRESFQSEVQVSRLYLREDVCMGVLESRVGFEPTTPGLEVRDPSDDPATQRYQEPPAGVRDGVTVDQTSPDDLPQKQEAALRRPSPCTRCDV